MIEFFYEVYDEQGVFGHFLSEENAERCAEYYEDKIYGDLDEDCCHVFITRYSFDDFRWAE